MIPVRSFGGKRVALFGLGGSGIATARALVEGGAEVLAWDDNPDSVAKAAGEGIPTGDLRTADWSGFASFVLSPGVPLTHPEAALDGRTGARRGRRDHRRRRAFRPRTQSAGAGRAIHRHHRHQRQVDDHRADRPHPQGSGPRYADGRQYRPCRDDARPAEPERHYVVECSSYQIDLAPSINPTAGILLNLTPDHLDRHGTMQHYASIKERLVAGSETAIIGVDDVYCVQIADRLERVGKEVIRISKRLPLTDGYFADGTDLMEAEHGRYSRIGFLEGIGSLRGQHNAQNALAAVAACLKVGLDLGEIQSGLESFPGLAHRMEQVGSKDHVLFVNDSKATNADAAAPALSSFPRIYWIAGGPAEGRRHRVAARLFPAHRQGLSDRRGRTRLFGDARRNGAIRDFRHARRRRRTRRADAALRRQRRGGRAACRRPARVSTSSRISRCAAKPSGKLCMLSRA